MRKALRSMKKPRLGCSLLFLGASATALGQATTATLVGSVNDSSGASVAGATVEITEQNTAQHQTAQTNETGNYEFTFLPPGTYTVRVVDQGFETAVTRNVEASVNTTVRTDVQLKPGNQAETITVTDQTPALQTDRADVSAQLGSAQVVELPVGNGRNFQALESLTPGVSASFQDHSSFFNAQGSEAFNVNGQAETANNLQLEGIDDNERTGLLQVYIPPAAAIETVDIETSNYAPEFGRSAGAVTNTVLKSGSNAFHGSAYEYNQVSAVQARSYFNRTAPVPRLTTNYFGAAVGGPILKNRTFFFVDYLGNLNHQSQFQLFTVPTVAFRNGNLSASTTPIYDPATGNAATGAGRRQFAGNQIPLSRFAPVSRNLLALIPLPNTNGTALTNNYQVNQGFRQDTHTFDFKIDQKLAAEDHLSYRYSFQRTNTVQDPAFGPVAGGPGNSGATGRNQLYNTAVEYTHLFSPRLFTEIRAGVNHYRNSLQQTDYGTTASQDAGIPGINVSPFTSGLASVTINTYSGPLVGYSPSFPWDRGESNIDLANNWTRVLGNHSLKFGAEVRRVRDDLTQGQSFGPRGAYTYADGQTGLAASGATPGSRLSFGNDFASFLLDLPNAVGRDVNIGDASWRQTLYFGFVQDTFQATRALTLTYGLRWEFYPPATPRQSGGFSQYDPASNSLLVAGYGAIPKDLGLRVNARDFQPRIGVAYRLNTRTVVRSGFGISNTPFQDNNYAFNQPVRQNISFNPLNSFVAAPANLESGFGPAPAVAVPASGIIANAPVSATYVRVNPQYKDPTVLSYNLTVEGDLGGGWVGTVAYVGNVGRQIPAVYNLNAGLVAGAGARGQPEFTAFGRTAATNLLGKGTNSNYNGLQARLTHRFHNGLSATSAYAYQKALGFISTGGGLAGFNFYLDPARDYAPLSWNRTHTFTQSFVYELPAGKGKQFLHDGIAGAVLGGWQVSGVLEVDSGTPLFITASSSQLNAPGTTQVPNLVAPFNRLHSIGAGRQWFDRNSFAAPVGAVLGNLGKNVFSGPGFATFDSTLSREIPLREQLSLQLRADGFNALNHPTFANPVVDSTSSSFGQVLTTANSGPRTLQFAATLRF